MGIEQKKSGFHGGSTDRPAGRRRADVVREPRLAHRRSFEDRRNGLGDRFPRNQRIWAEMPSGDGHRSGIFISTNRVSSFPHHSPVVPLGPTGAHAAWRHYHHIIFRNRSLQAGGLWTTRSVHEHRQARRRMKNWQYTAGLKWNIAWNIRFPTVFPQHSPLFHSLIHIPGTRSHLVAFWSGFDTWSGTPSK